MAPRTKDSSLTAMTYARLKDMIRRRELKGNEVIREERLSKALGVSRTPIRETLQRLEGEGLVLKTIGRSFIVRKVELAEYLNSLNVRVVLEIDAVRLSYGHIPAAEIDTARQELLALKTAPAFDREAHWHSDTRVHGLVWDHCGNPVLSRIVRSLHVTTNLFEIERVAERIEPDSTEHLGLLDALENGPVGDAIAAMRNHLESVRASATRHLLSAVDLSS